MSYKLKCTTFACIIVSIFPPNYHHVYTDFNYPILHSSTSHSIHSQYFIQFIHPILHSILHFINHFVKSILPVTCATLGKFYPISVLKIAWDLLYPMHVSDFA